MTDKVLEFKKDQDISDHVESIYKSDKFIISVLVKSDDPEENDQIHSYIPSSLSDMELVYLIKCLEERRDSLYGDYL